MSKRVSAAMTCMPWTALFGRDEAGQIGVQMFTVRSTSPVLLEGRDVGRGDVPEEEPLAGRLQEVLAPLRDGAEAL